MISEVTPHASVVIPTRNGMPLVERCLRSVLEQATTWPFEVIAIDSGSTDGTWELLKSLPIRCERIRPQDFNHGKTRNQGAQMARGQFVVFLVQDAVPANSSWLQRLVDAAELPNVAGSYGRQLPWPTDDSLVRLHMEHALPQPEHRAVQRLRPGQEWEALSSVERLALATFRDNASCLRREIWVSHPYRHLPYGEDLDWGAQVVRSGYAIVYEPQSAVYHSHDRSSFYELKRAYADHELVARLFGYRAYPRIKGVVASWVQSVWQAFCAIGAGPGSPTERLALGVRAPAVIGARHLGSYLGGRAAQCGTTSVPWRQIDGLLRKGV